VIERFARRLPFYYGWIVVAVVFVSMALGVNARTAFSLLFPPILEEFGWPRGVTAGAFSFGFLVAAVLTPLLGRLMDARGPRLVMELGVAVMAAGLLLAPLASAAWHFYATLGVLVGGGSVALGYTGQAQFLPSWFVRRRGLAMSIAFSGVGVGSIVVLPLLQSIIAQAGWRAACVALGLAVLLVAAPLNLLLRRRPEDVGLAPDGEQAAPPSGTPARHANVVDPAWAAIDWTLKRALRTARFWLIALAYFGALFAWYAVQVHQTKYLLEIGYGAVDAARALGAVSLVAIPGQIALGHLSDRAGREIVWAVGCAGFAVCYVALIWLAAWPSPLLLGVMIAAQGMLGYGLTSVLGAIPVEIFEGKQFGVIFGSLMVAALAGGAAGPWLTGVLHDVTGSYEGGFLIAIAWCAISALAIFLAAPRKVRAVAGRVRRDAAAAA
jgi:sugar phosphate permease